MLNRLGGWFLLLFLEKPGIELTTGLPRHIPSFLPHGSVANSISVNGWSRSIRV